ncbi:MAG: putative Ig domain-containing protein [Dokdonella sp.]|uniref:Ig domain-containing protein n=1 Tax=Dokdonella sp. TaxID=2291710 RepID=UPI0025C49571|nr:Ig domain-containing protein [Dokdonella sp.]MBX3701954.1 putative Ig domain-containing protein [Dokdonella sp.]
MLSRLVCLLAPLFLAATPALHGAEFTLRVGPVGPIGSCTHSTVQAAINAASSSPGDFTTILISGNATYNENLDISNKFIRLVGAQPCDSVGIPWTRPVLSGTGGARRSILNVNGGSTDIRLENLEFRNGDELLDDESYGGALDVTAGPHLIVIQNVLFSGNSAGYGGAVSVRGPNLPDGSGGATSSLYLLDNVVMSNNRGAYGGGGFYCSQALVTVQGMYTTFWQNVAGGAVETGSTPPSGGAYGGGVLGRHCDLKLAAGPLPAIFGNTASGPGGGLAMIYYTSRLAVGNLTPTMPTRITGNSSDRFGGGMTLEKAAQATLYDSIVADNSARQGGGAVALYVEGDEGRFTATSDFAEQEGRKRCSRTIECNLIANNLAYDGSQAKPGAAIRASRDDDGGDLSVFLRGTRLTGNAGATLFQFVDDITPGSSYFLSEGALFDHNDVTGMLFDGCHFRSTCHFAAVTIADNLIGATAVMFGSNGTLGSFSLQRSLVHQPGKRVVLGSTLGDVVRYSVVNDLSGINTVTVGGLPVNIVGTPVFADANNGKYYLAGGAGRDFAPYTASDPTRDRGNRNIDIPAVPNTFGIQDAGALETPVAAPVLYDVNPPDGHVGVPYENYTLQSNGQGGAVIFTATGLPPGLSLNPDTAVLSGTPPLGSEGTYGVTFRITNGLGQFNEVIVAIPIHVNEAPLFADGFDGS